MSFRECRGGRPGSRPVETRNDDPGTPRDPGGTSPKVVSAAALASRFAWPAALVAVFAMGFGYLRTDKPVAPTSEVRVEHAGPTVVRELRALSRLETTSLHVEKVIDLKDHQRRLHGLVEANDALLFVASGEVVIGVDLAKLEEGDVTVDARTGTARIQLPAPEVLSSRFDESRSYVHSRSTDLLAQRNEALEASARREAIVAFAAAGRDPKAIASAKTQAENQLRSLAKAWGAKDVVIMWKEPRGEVLPALAADEPKNVPDK